MTVHPKRSPTFVSAHEYRLLRSMALTNQGSFAADFLLKQLDRAVPCPPDRMPDDVVTMNSRVSFRIDDADETQSRYLVFPDDLSMYGLQITVLTPLGAALLGTRVGDRTPYPTPAGALHSVEVERIDFRPRAKILPFRPRGAARIEGEDRGPGAA